jgi:hypothetical protein
MDGLWVFRLVRDLVVEADAQEQRRIIQVAKGDGLGVARTTGIDRRGVVDDLLSTLLDERPGHLEPARGPDDSNRRAQSQHTVASASSVGDDGVVEPVPVHVTFEGGFGVYLCDA